MLNILLAVLPLLSYANDNASDIRVSPPKEDIRTLGTKDIAELAGKIGKSLSKCKELVHGAAVDISFTNATAESIDKNAFAEAIQAQLIPGGSIPGRKYDLQVKLASRAKQTGSEYEGTYTIHAQLKQAGEVLCLKSSKLVKKGSVTK